MKRIFMMAVVLSSCAALASDDELDRTATPPAPQRIELGRLDWTLSAGAELAEKGVLRICSTSMTETVTARAPLDLAALSGRSVRMRIRAAGRDLAQPLLPYRGLKFMLKLACADGQTLYPGARHKAGSWQETVELSALLQGVEVKGAELVLGLENCAGQVSFDMDSLVLEDCGSPFERVNRTHQAAYTPSVLSRPRRRGVMSPMRLEKLTEADFDTLKQWGANLMRYQISKDWKSPSAWLDLDEYDRYVDEMLDILDRRVLPWAVARGMSVVIDLHATPGSRIKTLENRIFFEEKYFRHYLGTWEKIARRFKGRKGVYGYDLVNEPKQSVAAPHSYLHAQLAAARAIRAIDAEVPVIVESNDYDKPYTYGYLSPLTLTNVIYSVHAYPPNEYTHQGFGAHANKQPLAYPDAAKGLTKASLRKALQPVRDFELRHHAKIYVGEFSTVIWAPGAAQYLRDLIDIFEEYGWDWSYHAFRESRLWDLEKNWSKDADGKDVFTPATTDTPRLRELKRGFRLNTDFQAQIDAAAAAGGGRVVVPRGRHVTPELHLRSNVELHLEHGAWLEGSPRADDYTFARLPYSEGDWAAVVSAYNVTNVSITGTGTICGNGGAFPQMSVWSGDAGRRRPRGLFFSECSGVRLEDFVLRDAAMWGIVFKCSENIVVSGVTVDSAANLNNDGIDIEARNVVIRDCDIDCCDDAVCVKSNNPDFTVENVLVSNVVARSQSNMLKIGTASHGTIRNVLFTDCRVEAPRRDFLRRETSTAVPTLCFTRPERLNYMKGLRPYEMTGISGLAVENVDGGIVENITFRNISVEGCAVPIFVRGGRRLKRKCGIPPSDKCVLRNILFENIVGSSRSSIANSITGVEGCRVKDVTLRNVHLQCRGAGAELSRTARTQTVRERAGAYPECNMFDFQILPAYCLYARHVDGLVLENVTDELQDGTEDLRDRIVLDDVTGYCGR